MPSFDIVSDVPWHEVDNALNQAQKELSQRFDFKDTSTVIEKSKEALTLVSSSEDRAKAAWTVLQEKLIKRKVSLKFFDPQKPEPTSKGGAKITVKVQEGIESDKAKKIIAAVKESKLKVQASIQEKQVRVTGKSKDDLQAAMQLARGLELEVELQFNNFRE